MSHSSSSVSSTPSTTIPSIDKNEEYNKEIFIELVGCIFQASKHLSNNNNVQALVGEKQFKKLSNDVSLLIKKTYYKALTIMQLPHFKGHYVLFTKDFSRITELAKNVLKNPQNLPSNLKKKHKDISDTHLVREFNEHSTLVDSNRIEVIQRIYQLKLDIFPSGDQVDDSKLGNLRLAIVTLYQCHDPKIKELALKTLIEFLEGDPLTKDSTCELVSLQKSLIKQIQSKQQGQENKFHSDNLQDLHSELQYLLVKAYALTLECILLQMYSPNPNIGKIEQSTKEEIMKGVMTLKDLLQITKKKESEKGNKESENGTEDNDDFTEGPNPEISFWLHYSSQAARRIKTEESDLKINLGRVWNIVRAAFSIARVYQNPESADVELEDAYSNLKNAFAFIGFNKDWFEDVLFIRKMSRYSLIRPELFSQLVYYIQTKKIETTENRKLIDKMPVIGNSDSKYEKKLLFGIVLDLETLILSAANEQIQESSLKLLLQYITMDRQYLRERIQKALSKMTASNNEKLKNTAILLLRFLHALKLVEKHNIPSSVFDKGTLQSLLNQGKNGKTLSHGGMKRPYYRHVIHFFLKRVAEIKGGGDYSGESFATLMAGSKEKRVVEAILNCIAEISPKLLEPNTLGRNLYHMSVERGNTHLVNFLGQSSFAVDINAKEYLTGDTPLHLAVKQGNFAMVRTLIANGANVNEKNEDGETPLHIAVRTEYCSTNLNVVSYLIRKKAYVNAENKKGKTPLNLSIECGNALVIDVLLYSYGKVKETIFGSNPLIVACVHAMNGNRLNEKVLEYVIKYLLKANKRFSPLSGIYIMEVLSKNGSELDCSQDFARFHLRKYMDSKKNYRKAFDLFKNRIQVIEENGRFKIKTANNATNDNALEFIKTPRGSLISSNNNFSLLRQGHFKINGEKGLGICTLHVAAVCGQTDVMTFLLNAGADINVQDKTKMTALHFAALYDQNEIIKFLLERGAIPNMANQYGDTPFMIYCGHIPERNIDSHFSVLTPEDVGKPDEKDLEIAELFIEKKAIINLTDKEGNNCLHHAVLGKNVEFIKELMKKNQKLFWRKNRYSLLPIDLAYQNGQKKEITALLSGFSPKELVDVARKYDKHRKHGVPFAHLLADVGEADTLKKLFKEDFSFALQTDGTARKESPIHRAVIAGHLSVLEAYLEFLGQDDFNLYLRDGFGNTFAHLAAFFKQKKILKRLNQLSYDFSKENDSVRLPVHHAAMTGDVKLLKLCQDRKFKFSKDGSGDLPIHIASRHGYIKAVTHLLEVFPDSLNIGNDEGNTPTHIAASQGYKDLVEDLLDRGYDPETPNIYSQTLMHLAAQEGKQPVFKSLIERKANLRAIDFEKETPLHKATFNHFENIVRMILKEGKDLTGTPPAQIKDVRDEIPLLEVLKKETVSAEEEQKRQNIIEMMLKNGSCLLQKNEDGQNFLHLVCKRGHVGILQSLLRLKKEKQMKIKMDFNACDNNENQCMHYAVEGGDENVLKFLLEDVDCAKDKANNKELTPLLFAAKLGKFSLCNKLLEKKTSLCSRDEYKMNILHHIFSLPYPLSDLGKKFLTKVVQKRPELLQERDNQKRTPLHLLAQNGHENCLDIVLHNLPKEMSVKKMNNYLGDTGPGKAPLQIFSQALKKNSILKSS